MVKNVLAIVLIIMVSCSSGQKENSDDSFKEITRADLLNNLYGGWVGMLIGGLEGLPHEFKYDTLPAESLPDFFYLPEGARTDDDNDFELTHLYFMDKEKTIKLAYPLIVDIWKANMNSGIWVANKRARDLMDQGIIPPATGDPENNSASSYNLSGQFCTESYGMIAPGMPQTAADIGTHYAQIAVSGEPVQATRFWTSLISLNIFHKGPVEEMIKEASKSLDPASAMAEVVTDAVDIYHENSEDWKTGRQKFYKKWVIERNWNGNSTPSNGGMVLLSLLYGKGDFHKTLQYAMAMGLDADCNAATAGAVLGVNTGFKNISLLPGFKMPDIYKNLTRPQLPAEMKISDQAELLMRICERVILENGGEKISIKGKPGYRIKIQSLNQ